MQSYSEIYVFTEEELSLYKKAIDLVDKIPKYLTIDERDILTFEELRCHELARAVGLKLNLPVIDGKYGIVEHSWLRTVGKGKYNVIDVYCVGSLPLVQLRDIDFKLPHQYSQGEPRRDIDDKIIEKLLDIL